jgi:hypothetical protein
VKVIWQFVHDQFVGTHAAAQQTPDWQTVFRLQKF